MESNVNIYYDNHQKPTVILFMQQPTTNGRYSQQKGDKQYGTNQKIMKEVLLRQ
jgi:hypothetical protein